jgi:hypothetical protein
MPAFAPLSLPRRISLRAPLSVPRAWPLPSAVSCFFGSRRGGRARRAHAAMPIRATHARGHGLRPHGASGSRPGWPCRGHVRSLAPPSGVCAPRPSVARGASDRSPRGVLSRDRSQSLAAVSARRACPHGYGRSPRARTPPLALTATFPRACRAPRAAMLFDRAYDTSVRRRDSMLRPDLPARLSAHSDSMRAAASAAASVACGGAPHDLTQSCTSCQYTLARCSSGVRRNLRDGLGEKRRRSRLLARPGARQRVANSGLAADCADSPHVGVLA